MTAATKHGASANTEAVLGILSLIVWTMFLIVTVKYVLVLLNADNKGEGGTFALMALGQSVANAARRCCWCWAWWVRRSSTAMP